MAIQVSGVNVIDDNRNANAGVVTATSLNVPPSPLTFSPTDGSSDVALNSNIVITYNTSIAKGSGNITLRDGSASGTVIETIAVSSGSVTLNGAEVTINPSDFPTGKDIYVVIDAGAFSRTSNTFLGEDSLILDTYNFSTGPVSATAFSPADGATGVAVDSNIVITFSDNIAKGSGNITLKAGGASGTTRQTIDVTSGAVSVSGTQATINPPSDLQYEEDTYIVVDAGCFTNTDGDDASDNAIINTYNFTTAPSLSIGDAHEGGYLICCSSNNYWIVSPSSTEVARAWFSRNDAITTAQANAACGDWFIPSCTQLQNPGYTCRTYWDSFSSPSQYWSNTQRNAHTARSIYFNSGGSNDDDKPKANRIRAFRCVSY